METSSSSIIIIIIIIIRAKITVIYDILFLVYLFLLFFFSLLNLVSYVSFRSCYAVADAFIVFFVVLYLPVLLCCIPDIHKKKRALWGDFFLIVLFLVCIYFIFFCICVYSSHHLYILVQVYKLN
jgi:hypothetical protein